MAGLLMPICSIIFSGLLCFIYFYKKRIKLIENNVFSAMLIASITDSILVSILQSFPQNGITEIEVVLVGIFNKIDFITLIVFSNCLLLYTLLITYKKARNNFRQLLKIFTITDLIVILFIILGSIDIISNKGNYSIAGTSIFITIVICAIYLLAALIISVANIRKADKRYIPMFSMIFISLFLIILYNINPYLIIISITLTFINYLMYFTIENPDVKLLEQVEIAKEQSDKANRAKTEFLSSMSHEIRTPLNAIVGFSDYIINAESLEEAKENAKDIVNASQTLLEIVNSILDISKIEAGKMEIVNTKYKAKETFESLAKLVTPKMNEKGLDFTYYIAPDIPNTLFGDAANIKKVVTNLLSNAYKYTEKGFVKYEVNCVNTNDLSKLIITVEDSGRGIKQDKIDKLFTKFQRLDEDKNTTIEGTGLGLAITKQLTELMGGKILVHTVYGQGSKFTIIITQKIETSVEVEPQETKQEVKKELDLTDKKILIVDDNELNLKVASKVLGKFNANKLTTITSGFECIDKIKANEKYDLILLDDMMPKMSGIETLKKLKEIANFNIPVVALTANAIAGMKEKYIKEGFSDYLAKPLEKDELIRVMNEFLFDYDKEPFEDTEILDIIEEELEEPIIQELSIPKESETQYLKEKGVDLEKALSLLEDMDTYNDTIKEFLSQAAEKWKKIKTYKENNDLENYEKEIQSLKRDAENLGFIDLEEYLARHELKANVKDPKYIETHFSELKKEYKKIIKIAEDYIELI